VNATASRTAEDPHTVTPGTIKDIRIVQTLVGGEPTYTA